MLRIIFIAFILDIIPLAGSFSISQSKSSLANPYFRQKAGQPSIITLFSKREGKSKIQRGTQRIAKSDLFSVPTDAEIQIEKPKVIDTNFERAEDIILNGADDMQNSNSRPNDKLLGVLVLLTVPLSWGTYAPVVKYVYEIDPPLPGFVFSAGYYLIASITLTLLIIIKSWKEKGGIEQLRAVNDSNDEMADLQMNIEMLEEQEMKREGIQRFLPLQAIAGIELGSYLFIGNCLQVVGLKTVPADRASFLVQLTTVMVPLFSAILAGNLGSIPIATWVACLLAFLGVLVMGLDQPGVDLASMVQGVDMSGLAFSGGDILITLAAVSYTMHVIRLGRYAKYTQPLNLAASKATVEAILSTGLVAALMTSGASTSGFEFIRDLSAEIQSYFTQIQNALDAGTFPPVGSAAAFGACLWTGWVTCAYTIYAQSFGQRRVNPTDANLIYTTQPIFSSLFAYFLLGESLGLFGFGGATLIFFALWVVTSNSDKS